MVKGNVHSALRLTPPLGCSYGRPKEVEHVPKSRPVLEALSHLRPLDHHHSRRVAHFKRSQRCYFQGSRLIFFFFYAELHNEMQAVAPLCNARKSMTAR